MVKKLFLCLMCMICMNQHTAEQSFSENFNADEALEIINNEIQFLDEFTAIRLKKYNVNSVTNLPEQVRNKIAQISQSILKDINEYFYDDTETKMTLQGKLARTRAGLYNATLGW